MFKPALLIAAGAAVLSGTPAEARYRHHHFYRHHFYASYYSPYRYRYAYPAYSYSYPVYYDYPAYYSYPAYSYPSYSISIGLGGGYRHHRRW